MSETDPQERRSEAPGTPEPPRLRRSAFGYKRSDVDEALQTRDAQLVELRQDIAALWLAFAQHDRILKGLETDRPPEAPPVDSPPAAAADEELDLAIESPEAIGAQLAGLDEVLSAIESATQTLERTYADEIAAAEKRSEDRDETGDERIQG